MKTHTLLLGALVLGLAPALARATTYYVKPANEGGSDSNDGKSWETAFATPTKGFSAVNNKNSAGLELVIGRGEYDLSAAIGCTGGYDNESRRVVIRGETGNPADVVLRGPGNQEVLRLATRITVASLTLENGSNNGSKDFSGVRVGTASGDNVVIVSNCVIRGCSNTYSASSGNYKGAAAYVYSNGLLVDCVVSNNTALYRGAAVALDGVNATALRCTIAGNVATNAADATSSTPTSGAAVIGISGGRLIDCTVFDNLGTIAGGALNIAEISGCTFRGNAANFGAGAYVGNGVTSSFTNCLFESNVATFGGGGAIVAGSANVSFDDCRFFGNQTTSTVIGDNYGGGGILLFDQTTAGWCSVSNSVFGSNATGGRGGAFAGKWNAYCQAAIENCIFTNNVSYRQGGAICLREDSNHKHTDRAAIIRNCLVVGNRTMGPSDAAATAGGILLVTYNDVEVANCTVVSNVASYASDSSSGGGIYQRWGGRVVNCIIVSNKTHAGSRDDTDAWTSSSGTFLNCCSYPNLPSLLTSANGCINADPKFTDAENGDFTLKRSSPCRNAGRALDWMPGAFDLSGAVARNSESYPDIGCYEIPETFKHTIVIFN